MPRPVRYFKGQLNSPELDCCGKAMVQEAVENCRQGFPGGCELPTAKTPPVPSAPADAAACRLVDLNV